MNLSVIIPTHWPTQAPFLHEHLAALHAQNWPPDTELLVVTYGPPTPTDKRHPREPHLAASPNSPLRWLNAVGNPSPAHAENLGAREASGTYLAFLSPTDLPAPGYLLALYNALQQHPFVAARLAHTRFSLQPAHLPRTQEAALPAAPCLPGVPVAYGGSLGILRSHHLRLGGFDETLPGDIHTDYCLRAHRAGLALHFVPEALLHVRPLKSLSERLRAARRAGLAQRHLASRYQPDLPPVGLPRLAGHLAITLGRLARARTRSTLQDRIVDAAQAAGAFLASLSASPRACLDPFRNRLLPHLRPVLRPRAFHAFAVGTEKSGTHSLAALCRPGFRSLHEPAPEAHLAALRHRDAGHLSPADISRWLRQRDASLWLEMESSWLLRFWIRDLVRTFPDAKFLLPVRHPRAWLNSLLCHLWFRHVPPAWIAFQHRNFAPERWRHAPEERTLEARGFLPLDAYLSTWTAHNTEVLSLVPPERLLVLRTTEISASLPRIAAFLGIPPARLNPERSHEYRAVAHLDFLAELPAPFLQQKLQEHCGPLLATFFANDPPEARTPRKAA